jgi:hypothetical protein
MKDAADYPRPRKGPAGRMLRLHYRRQATDRPIPMCGPAWAYYTDRLARRLLEGPTYRPGLGLVQRRTVRLLGRYARGERPCGRVLGFRLRYTLMRALREEIASA